jgi:hypothetical protein
MFLPKTHCFFAPTQSVPAHAYPPIVPAASITLGFLAHPPTVPFFFPICGRPTAGNPSPVILPPTIPIPSFPARRNRHAVPLSISLRPSSLLRRVVVSPAPSDRARGGDPLARDGHGGAAAHARVGLGGGSTASTGRPLRRPGVAVAGSWPPPAWALYLPAIHGASRRPLSHWARIRFGPAASGGAHPCSTCRRPPRGREAAEVRRRRRGGRREPAAIRPQATAGRSSGGPPDLERRSHDGREEEAVMPAGRSRAGRHRWTRPCSRSGGRARGRDRPCFRLGGGPRRRLPGDRARGGTTLASIPLPPGRRTPPPQQLIVLFRSPTANRPTAVVRLLADPALNFFASV